MPRRDFLRRMSLAATASLTLDGMLEGAEPVAPEKRRKIIIAGAGMAGLCAAYELEKLGHECVILEADTGHVGGRVRTLRLEDGLHGEAGAMRIPENHQITRRYIKDFGLNLRRFISSNEMAWVYAKGKRWRSADANQAGNEYSLSDKEKNQTPSDWWKISIVDRLNRMTPEEKADLLADQPKTELIRRLDQLSLQQLLESDGISAEAIEWLAIAYGQEALLGSAATEHLREELENVWNLSFDEIVGGTDTLAKAFVERLKNPPRQGCEIVRIESAPDKAVAIFRNRKEGGALEKEEGDFLICTLPCPVLSRLETPGFSGSKLRAIRHLGYDSATKVLALTRRRFWETDDKIYGGGTFTDLPTGTTWYPSDNAEVQDPAISAKPSLFLASYCWGQQARRLGMLEAGPRAETVLTHLAKVHPQLTEPDLVIRSIGWSWDRHPWSGGAFAWFNPSQHTNLHHDLLQPEGQIHFAGEHTSLSHTWIQGALESGLRCVKEITSLIRK